MTTPRKRILTGDRPTGKPTSAIMFGSWPTVFACKTSSSASSSSPTCTLTTKPEREHIEQLGANVRDMVLDDPAVGIDPQKSTIFRSRACRRPMN